MRWDFYSGTPYFYVSDATLRPRPAGGDGGGDAIDAALAAGEALVCGEDWDEAEHRVAVFVDEAQPDAYATHAFQRAPTGVLRVPGGRLVARAVIGGAAAAAERSSPDTELGHLNVPPGVYVVDAAWLHWPREEREQKLRAVLGEREWAEIEARHQQRVEARKSDAHGCRTALALLHVFLGGLLLIGVAAFLEDGRTQRGLRNIGGTCVAIAVTAFAVAMAWQLIPSKRRRAENDALWRDLRMRSAAMSRVDTPDIAISLRRLTDGEPPPAARGVRLEKHTRSG